MDNAVYPMREQRSRFYHSALTLGSILLCHFFVSIRAHGQIEMRMNDVKPGDCEGGLSLEVIVVDENKHRLDRQSVVKLHDQKLDLTAWQTTSNASNTLFCNVDFGDFDIDVSAAGYLMEHKVVNVLNKFTTLQDRKVEVVLHKDPAAVELGGSDDTVPSNLRKDLKRAASDLKSNNLKAAQKRLDKIYQAAPSSSYVNFLMGYLSLQLKEEEKAEGYLSRSAKLDPGRVQTLTLLGRVQLQREHYDQAQKTLEQAATADSENWTTHNLLADAYLKKKEYEKAREQAQIAIDKGNGAANAVQLVLGQALANVGRDQEGIQAFKTFLQADPKNPAASQVQALITQIKDRDSGRSAGGELPASGDLTLAAAPPTLPPSAWGPPGVDDVKPSVVAGVTCPTPQVVEAAGVRVKELVDNITRFAAVEDVVHQQLDPTGNPITKETRKFNYVASISEPRPGFLATDEYRDLRYGISDLPDHIQTTGFMTLALIFHPDMQGNFEMTCEGLGDWHTRPTWLVHFRQRDDKPSRFADYRVGSDSYPMKLKGRAWINANDFQIVHIESDLASPLPELSVEHQSAEYGPVHFAHKSLDLWLPQNVHLFFELRRHRYHRRHSFDHFMLFDVNAQDKVPVSKNAPPSSAPIQNP